MAVSSPDALTRDTFVHRFAKTSPMEKCAKYCVVPRKRFLKREYTPKDSRLQYKLPEDSMKIPLSTARSRPEDHTADILITSDNRFGLSVYTWDMDAHRHFKMSEIKIYQDHHCFSTTVSALGTKSLSVYCNGVTWFGNICAKHCLVYPSSEMTLGDYDRCWRSVEWQKCHIEGEGGEKEPDPFWYPRPGTTQILWLENLLNIAILCEDDPNDLTSIDLYSRVRRDDIKSLDDIVKNDLHQICLQLLEFVVAEEEEYLTHSSEEESDLCDIILNGRSLLHFLNEKITVIQVNTDSEECLDRFTENQLVSGATTASRKVSTHRRIERTDCSIWCHHHNIQEQENSSK